MICYKLKDGVDFCRNTKARRWVQRIVLLNKFDVVEEQLTDYSIKFKTKTGPSQTSYQVGGKDFQYPETFSQILGNAEASFENDYYQWRHNVQISLMGFEYFEILDSINRGEIFAALMDYSNKVWIFGYEFGLIPDDYLYQHIEMDTITLRSRVLEDTPPLLYTGDSQDFWNNFTEVDPLPFVGDFNNDFNDDFSNEL